MVSLIDVFTYKTRLWVQLACLDKGLGFATMCATEIGNLWESLSTTMSKCLSFLWYVCSLARYITWYNYLVIIINCCAFILWDQFRGAIKWGKCTFYWYWLIATIVVLIWKIKDHRVIYSYSLLKSQIDFKNLHKHLLFTSLVWIQHALKRVIKRDNGLSNTRWVQPAGTMSISKFNSNQRCNIHCPQRMRPNVSGVPLTSSSIITINEITISQHQLDGLLWNHIHVHLRTNSKIFWFF